MLTKPTLLVWHPFGYEYDVVYEGVRRLFGYDARVVFEADHEGRFLLIEDHGIRADYNDPAFEDMMNEQVAILTFDTSAQRDAYLDRYVRERPWLLERIDEARRRR